MSILGRLIKGALRGSGAPGDAPTRAANAATAKADDERRVDAAVVALREQVVALCGVGQRRDAVVLLKRQLPAPRHREHALQLLRRLFDPLLDACVEHGDAVNACEAEYLVYTRLIRSFEDPAHYEAGLSHIDARLHRLGTASAPLMRPGVADAGARGLLFFVHSLSNELAHLTLMCELIDAYLTARPDDVASIGLVGVGDAVPAPSVQKLQAKWGVKVWPLTRTEPYQHAYIAASRLLDARGFDRLVVVGPPGGLSYLSGVLGTRLAWLTMKFQLTCFEHLRVRCSFRSGTRRVERIGPSLWRQAAPLFKGVVEPRPSGKPPAALDEARRGHRIVFYTVNREEKIRNPVFLEAVADVLERVPDSAFVWTGQRALAEIEDHFEARGLGARQFFAGWVVPDDLVLGGDIFLDTPVLSGVVAAQAAAAGRPVVTDGGAVSWIGTCWPAFEADRSRPEMAALDERIESLAARGFTPVCRDASDYVEQAVRLANDPSLRQDAGDALRLFCARYFFDAARGAVDHFDNLRAPPPA